MAVTIIIGLVEIAVSWQVVFYYQDEQLTLNCAAQAGLASA